MKPISLAAPLAAIGGRRNRSIHISRFALAGLIVAGLVFQFWRSDTRALAVLQAPSPGPLALAALMGTASYFLFLEAWRRLRGLREAWQKLGSVWFASLFARYAPGGLWQGAVRVGGAHVAGESKRIALERYLAEQALACFSATTLALALFPFATLPAGAPLLGMLAAVATAALAAAIVGPRLGIALHWSLSAVFSMLGGHLLMALGFAAMIAALAGTISAADAASYMVMFLAAGVAGLLVVFVPAGIGVREAVLAGLLAPGFGVAPAIAIALAARVWLLACEAAAFGLWWLATRRRPIRSPDAPAADGRR